MSERIATTQWSQVLAVQQGTDTEARQALESLCQTYWEPIYAFLRHLGSDSDEASDLTQAYFAELLEKNFLAEVESDRGRFRSFLYTSVRHFLYHQRDKSRALKRGGGSAALSLDMALAESNYALQPRDEMTPQDLFEHRWAMTLLTRAMNRLHGEAKTSGSEQQFKQLSPFLTSGRPQQPYREVAQTLGMSEGSIKVAVHRLRKRFGQCLRAELSETVADPAEVDAELRHMLSVLSR